MKKIYEQVVLAIVVFDEDAITTSGLDQKVCDDDNVVTWFGA